jgi:hypothetical protein
MRPLEHICSMLDCDKQLYSRLRSALERLNLSGDDTLPASERLGDWYDLSLEGVRRLLRLYIEEFTALFEKNSAYRIYATVPCPTVIATALNNTGAVRVHTAELCAMVVLQGILGLDGGDFSPTHGCGCCTMLENRFGLITSGALTKPDLLWSFGLLCDECPKTDEQLSACTGLSSIVSLCPRLGGVERFPVYERSLRENLRVVCIAAGATSLDDKRAWNEARLTGLLSGGITCTSNNEAVPLLKAGTLSLIHTALLMAFGDVSALITALESIRRELRDRKTVGTVKKLYCYYIPSCLPQFGACFSEAGVELVGDAAFITLPVTAPHGGDLAGMASASWQSSILSRSTTEYAVQTALAVRHYGCSGYLTGQFFFDKWLGAGHKLSMSAIERLSGKPSIWLDTDFWGRDFCAERVRTVADTLSYTLK